MQCLFLNYNTINTLWYQYRMVQPQLRDIKKQLEWLLQFKEVVLCFDNDKVGSEAAQEVAALFPPKFVRIVNLPLKDANDMLTKGRSVELSNALRDAKTYTPDGILNGADILDRLENEKEVISFPFPDFLSGTNDKLKGIRLSELTVFTAGTGSGKRKQLCWGKHYNTLLMLYRLNKHYTFRRTIRRQLRI